ncbi:transposase, partial [Streptomyces parvulus]|uniref:transposase n=1 Tax=Streptomyces parvulus TaxID=146923 RepID=UPI003F4DF354
MRRTGPRSCPQSGGLVGLFVVRRHELTDESWAVIEPFLAPPRMGRPVRDRRQVVNGILWKLS